MVERQNKMKTCARCNNDCHADVISARNEREIYLRQNAELRAEVEKWSGMPPENLAMARQVGEKLYSVCTESVKIQKQNTELLEFVGRIAKQTPEKPDYWCACGQCERNANDAQDILANAQDDSQSPAKNL